MLPELKPTAKLAENTARQRGYVRTIAGRCCHLPGVNHNQWRLADGRLIDKCHIAISRVIQGSAADIFKQRMVSLRYAADSPFRSVDRIVCQVHDELLMEILDNFVSEVELLRYCNAIRRYLEYTPFPLSVPLRCDGGYSRKNWADVDANKLPR
jgi:DNA polymerase I-like protein with 3'-5' exonuclease and polymerase domains